MSRLVKISAALFSLMLLGGIATAAQDISVDAATLGRYVGFYRIGDKNLDAVMAVSISGTHLITQVTGQQPFDVYPETASHFVLRKQEISATIDFVANGTAPATALILHQDGQDITMPRLDDAAAARFNSDLAAHIKSNTARPGSEAAARDFFVHLTQGSPPDYTKMSPQLAELSKKQESGLIDGVGTLGALQSLTFQGVGEGGADTYLVKFLNGALLVHINLDSNGIINGLALQPAP